MALLLADKAAIRQSASRADQQLKDALLCVLQDEQRAVRFDVPEQPCTQNQGSQQRDHEEWCSQREH
ncbi:MAG: Uncharacterised protein [Prochlorococcus marinus str. MIT 9313]|nr:MAG: Uncharacterised protein [Prochlorococcus marinus str. MIT 9313]